MIPKMSLKSMAIVVDFGNNLGQRDTERLGNKGRTVMKLQHLTRLVEIYGKWESQANARTSTSEKIGQIYTDTDFVDGLCK
jgi:hypothetical protein